MEMQALIFDIKRDCSEDGPGIRTTVFFKGCPLSCVWCQNPEGSDKQPSFSFRASACHPESCGAVCVAECQAGCLQLNAQGHLTPDWSACTRCDRCFSVCPTKALEPVGYWISLDELMYRVAIDKPFYQTSGGGVTLSGGEAAQQMAFNHLFLQRLKAEGIHTALETSGFFNYRRFKQQLLPWLDLIYFDLKLINEAESRKYTGQSNKLILENFMKLVKDADIPVIPRIPLIPGITTTKENLQGIARFLADNGIGTATLIPYNPLWKDKTVNLGKAVQFDRSAFMTTEEQQACVIRFQTTEPAEKKAGSAN